MTDDAIQRAVALLEEAQSAVAMTGAGVSAASGLSTFRAESGIWSRFPMEEYGVTEAFVRDPERTWRLFGAIEKELDAAEPNPAHEALAVLEERGRLAGVVTQNIDGLHQEAGSSTVVEFHGTSRSAHCPKCRERFTRGDLPSYPPAPRCPTCDAIVRPDVVLFGDPIPMDAVSRAESLFNQSDLVLSIGASLEVAPASWLVLSAASRGVPVITVDLEPSPLVGSVATVLITEPAEVALPKLVI